MKLFLCEKPSQAKDLARVLGATARGNGCIKGPGIVVTWGIGHLLEQAPPDDYDERYKSWKMEDLPIIPELWRIKVKPKTASQYKVVRELLKEASHLCIATDADREGEMIARELVDYCNYKGQIERLWLSALNDASIRSALSQVKDGRETEMMYQSALARSRADWLIGMNFTRLFTLLGRQAGYGGVLSVGRVQTPTLRLVVDRDREIADFKPLAYWDVEVSLSANGGVFTAQWVVDADTADDQGRCLDRTVAVNTMARLAQGQVATAVMVDVERVREAPPLLLDLSGLQELCSRKLGLGVLDTLAVAQSLYETHKAVTYPRADNGYLPESMLGEVDRVLAAVIETDPSIGDVVSKLDPRSRSRAWNDAKVTAHHGIIPTLEAADLSAMSDRERSVYKLIRMHYLAQFAPAHEYDRTVADFDCQGVSLRAVGKQIVVPGWREMFIQHSDSETDPEKDSAAAQVLPQLQNGSRCSVNSAVLKDQKTSPPKAFTEGSLIKAMKNVAKLVKDPRLAQKLKETTGIGTEATRANVIQGLIDRGYLLKKGRSVKAADPAFTLIDAVPAALADPGTTAIWEQALDMIEAGTMTLQDFLAKQSSWIDRLVTQYRTVTLQIALPSSPACPKCEAAMIQRRGKAGNFWACSTYPACSSTLPCEDSSPRSGKSAATRKARQKSKSEMPV
ncbi:DNA topoisomerase III [Pseudomonas ficuserectae]|uniref:DNA topoisomerase III n=2 Tax=Pseudomonas ficuserectae TaxID=53410 RepID=UPI0006D603F8|nr:DNA topoisomerase III [Pseudomonas ficuserectae]KPX35931.1 hypothetical protein ALO69_200009 [Pseudomonas ficuserectae]RMS38522.1 hypothetical protein ALP68_200130 [Pseudomonas ficuserectae]